MTAANLLFRALQSHSFSVNPVDGVEIEDYGKLAPNAVHHLFSHRKNILASVALEHIERVFKERKRQVHAVRDLCLHVNDGELLTLVGPSGCGKTTTLRVIAGLDEPSAGTIRIEDRVVNRVLPKDRDVAMVFQNYALYPHMTVYQNIAFPLRMRK